MDQPPPPPMLPPADRPSGVSASRSDGALAWILGALALGAGLMIVWALVNRGGFLLNQLQETAIARGLITFLVAIATVTIALTVAMWVVAPTAKGELLMTRFTYAKDVLSTLVGMLGTILGFYFGSTKKTGAELLMLDARFSGDQLVSYVTGGKPPYGFVITCWNESAVEEVSRAGWLVLPPSPTLTFGAGVTFEVNDAANRNASRVVKYLTAAASAPALP
jgi:hypothetical protein